MAKCIKCITLSSLATTIAYLLRPPSAQQWTYDNTGNAATHDALGRILTKTDQQSDTCTSEYDLAGRLTTKVYKTGGTTTEHTYALDGLPLTEKLVADNRTYTSSRTYDAANRPLTHTYPSGETTHWAYDARNIVTTYHTNFQN